MMGQARAGLDQELARALQGLQPLLLDALQGRFLDIRATRRFRHRQCIVWIGLVSLAKRCHRLRWNDLHTMAVALRHASPIMRCGARLKGHHTRSLLR
jgi:hypothetical protein